MISSLLSRFEFADRRALLLGAHKAAVYEWQQGRLGRAYLFDVGDNGRQHFARYLRESAPAPFCILLDVFAEEFRTQSIPHVFGADRAAIIKRRQARLFAGTPYCHYALQGRDRQGRRDDRILLSAVTDADVLTPWVELLAEYKVPLAGIHSIPLLSAALLKRIPDACEHMLLVSLQSVSGLRQSLYQQGELKISRLVQMPRYGATAYAPCIAAEVEKIRRYINSLRLTGEDAPLGVYFLAAGELLQALAAAHTDSEAVQYHAVDLNALADSSHVNGTGSRPFADQFFVQEFLTQAPANCYARRADTRYFSLRRLRHAMLATALAVTAGSAVWSGLNLVSGLSYQQRSLSAQDKAQFYRARYQIARARLPRAPVAAAELQRAVQLADALRSHKTTPLETISLISKGLERFPEIQLRAIEWTWGLDPHVQIGTDGNDGNPAAAQVAAHATTQAAPSGGAGADVNRADAQAAPSGAASPAAPAYRLYQVSTLSAYIEPFDGDFRAAIALINDLAEALRTEQAAYAVSILRLPLDISPAASLNGSARATAESANFSLRLVVEIRQRGDKA